MRKRHPDALIGVGLVAVWLAAGWWELRHGGLLSIPLPRRTLPIPLLYWCGWPCYAWWLSRASRQSLRACLARTFWPALAAHGLLLVTDLDQAMWDRAIGVVWRGYVAYYVAALGMLLVGLGVAAGRFARRRIDQDLVMFLPLYGGAAVLYSHLALRQTWWAFAATGMGLWVSWVWPRWPRVRAWWAGACRWMASPRGAAILLWVAAWAVRWAYAVRLMSATGEQFVLAGDDSNTYDEYAWRSAQDPGQLLAIDPQGVYPPGYWMLLAMLYRIFGHHFGPPVFIQVCVSALVPVCVYWMTRRMIPSEAGDLVAKLAGILTVLNTALIHSSVVLDQEAFFLPFLFCGLCALMRAVGEPSARAVRWFIAAGAWLGLSAFARPIILFLPGVVVLWLLWLRRPLRQVLRDAAWLTVSFCLVLMPLVIRNALASGGKLIAVTATAAGHYRVSGNEQLLALGIDPFGDPWGSLLAFLRHPLAVVQAFWAVVPGRLIFFFFVPFFGTFDPILIFNANAFATAYALHLEFYAYAAIGLGLWRTMRRAISRPGSVLLLGVAAYFSLIPVFWYVRNATYRVGLHPIFLIWLAAGAVGVWSWSRRPHPVTE